MASQEEVPNIPSRGRSCLEATTVFVFLKKEEKDLMGGCWSPTRDLQD